MCQVFLDVAYIMQNPALFFCTPSPATVLSLGTLDDDPAFSIRTRRHHQGYDRKLFIKLPIADEWAIYKLMDSCFTPTDGRVSSRKSVLF